MREMGRVKLGEDLARISFGIDYVEEFLVDYTALSSCQCGNKKRKYDKIAGVW